MWHLGVNLMMTNSGNLHVHQRIDLKASQVVIALFTVPTLRIIRSNPPFFRNRCKFLALEFNSRLTSRRASQRLPRLSTINV